MLRTASPDPVPPVCISPGLDNSIHHNHPFGQTLPTLYELHLKKSWFHTLLAATAPTAFCTASHSSSKVLQPSHQQSCTTLQEPLLNRVILPSCTHGELEALRISESSLLCCSTTAVGTEPTRARRGSRARSGDSRKQRRNQCSRIPTEVLAYMQLSDSPPKGRGHSADTHAEKQIAISLYTPSFRAHLHHGEALLHSLPPC